MSVPAYDLIEVNVGSHTIAARPIEWDGKDYDGAGNGENGQQINAIVFMTTCPACAQLVQFNKTDIYTADDKSINNVRCTSCNLGRNPTPSPDDIHDLVVVLDEPEQPSDDEADSAPSADIFIDPILSGDYEIAVDADRL